MVRGANEKGGQGKLKRNCVIDWSYVENKVKLTYADGTVLFVRRDDFDRATTPFEHGRRMYNERFL